MDRILTALKALPALLVLLAVGCATNRIPQSTSGALVLCEVTSSAMSAQGKGIKLVFLNRQTGQAYRSEARAPLSPICYVSDLPAGSYFIVDLRLPIGNLEFRNSTEEMAAHFGSIDVETGQAYYLGSFRGKQKVGFKNVVSLATVDSVPTNKLAEVLRDDGGRWSAEDLMYVGPTVGSEVMLY